MNKIKRHIFILCISILIFMALIPNKASFAAEYKSLWQYPKDELAELVERCFVSNESYGRTSYRFNNEMISLLHTEDKAKIFAEAYNCYNGRVTSEDKDISKYIGIFSDAYQYFYYGKKYEFLKTSEAGEFFNAVCDYLTPAKSQDKKDDLIYLIDSYLARLGHDKEYLDEHLENYKQVLDIITIIDGKITSGSNKCTLISKKKQSVKIGSKYEDHNVAFYLVTKPGTIKYSSIDGSTGQLKKYKKKFISLTSAIDKELVKTHFSDKQLKNLLTVKKATFDNVKKIHKLLLTDKEQLIKIPTSKEKANKILSELENMIAEYNKGGYQFLYKMTCIESDSAVYVHITEEYAKAYNLCAEFYERLEKQYKEKIKGWSDLDYKDSWYYVYKEYPDEQERLINICYDQLVHTVLYDDIYNKEYYAHGLISGYDSMITSEGRMISFGDIDFEELNESYTLKYLSEDLLIKNKTNDGIELYSLDEFRHFPDIDEILEEYRETVGFMNNEELKDYVEKHKELTIARNTLMHTLAEKPFYKLSDAEKLYAISLSGVFSCVYKHPDNGSLQMVYNRNNAYKSPYSHAEALKNLLDGSAEGVCEDFAKYECLVFDTLGFTSYINGASKLQPNHGWSVVKIKNLFGKEFWVPFDYGVALTLSDEIYIDYIETDGFRGHMGGIEEDPKYIPFTLKDFTE